MARIQALQCEINVVEHCNLACRACSHVSPVMPRHSVDPDALRADLSRLAQHYRARRAKLQGGEPLLHPELLALIEVVRESKIADEVRVTTNGVLLPGMPAAFWAAVDMVDVTLYPGQMLTEAQRDECRELAAEHGVRLRLREQYVFRESYSEAGTDDRRLVQRIYDTCGLRACHTVADGVFYTCPPAYFLPKLLHGKVDGADGVRLDDDDLRARLLEYLGAPEPLVACRNCLGSAGRRFEHIQAKGEDFRRLQGPATEQLVDLEILESLEGGQRRPRSIRPQLRYREDILRSRLRALRSDRSQSAPYSVLSTSPPIIYVKQWIDERFRVLGRMGPVFDFLRNEPATFLYSWQWTSEDWGTIGRIARAERHHLQRWPAHRFVHLCNTPLELERFTTQGLTAIFCNHGSMLDERIFRPLAPLDGRPYDAVYDGRLKNHKRHELALDVTNLALIYDLNPAVDDPSYVEAVRGRFPNAHFFNHEAPAYRSLSPTEVNDRLNRCRVGLCLSAKEGAMYASGQYLLAGLPVVSTVSRGGRDVFFDEEHVLIVPDDRAAVTAGVKSMIARRLDPVAIRERVLELMQPHRRRLVALVQQRLDEGGSSRDFASEWDGVFFNKLARNQQHAETLELFAAAGASS